MNTLIARALAALLLAVSLAGPVLAQGTVTPGGRAATDQSAAGVGSNAATDRGVYSNPQRAPLATEQELLDVLRVQQMPPGKVSGTVYIPDSKAAILIQPEGRGWRDFRVGTSRWIHGGLILLAILAVAALAAFRGSQDYQRDPQGRRILRFRPIDRFVHWIMAVSFVLLALTGLNILFGRVLIQPWLGDAAFSTLTQWGLVVHNATGLAFGLSVIVMAVLWLRDNLFSRVDMVWFRRGGGLLTGEHIPSDKFNAGQKLIYWSAVIFGLALLVTGVLMMIPIATLGVVTMQVMHGIHTLVAALMIAIIIGHVYLGSWGVQGSFDAMSRGDVDLEWARTHHPLWVERKLRGAHPTDPALRPGPAE